MPNQTAVLDDAFRALADPTRRAVLERLSRGTASVSELAQPFDMALPSFLQHLRVLEDSGLIRSHKVGRVRTCAVNSLYLNEAESWLTTQRKLWEKRLDQLDSYLMERRNNMPMKPTYEFDPKRDLVLERTVDVPRELVWKAWTEPEHLMKWFCPRPWKTTECEIDLRPGGKFYTRMRGPDGEDFGSAGCYLEVVENEKLIFTDALGPGYRPAEKPFFTAIVLMERRGKGTKYTAYAIHGDEAGRKQHEEMGFHDGWGKAWDQLVELLKSWQ